MLRRMSALLLVLACAQPAPQRGAHVAGEVSAETLGDVFLFLYEAGEGPPEAPAPPLYATAVSQERIASGARAFVFADVAEGDYRLWGFVDVNRNAAGASPLLVQPGRGDVLLGAQPVSVDQGGGALAGPVVAGAALAADPHAFSVESAEGEVRISDTALSLSLTTLTLDSREVAGVGGEGFEISLADRNGDGAADDQDGDLIPDLYPQIFLRFLPRPGQAVPLDSRGRPAEIVVPVRFAPGAFLAALGGDPSARITVPSLTTAVIPSATAVFREPGGRRLTTALEAVPVGSYELLVISESGQLWTVPNGLDASQATRFTVVHGA